MNKNCEEFQKMYDEFNEKIEELQKNYIKIKEKGNVNLDDGKNFLEEIEVLKDKIMEKIYKKRQLMFFYSSYSVYKEIEQDLFMEDFGQLFEMEMRKDGTIIAKTETLKEDFSVEYSLVEINWDNEISLILNNAGDKLGKLCLGDESIFVVGDCDVDGKYSQNFYEINLETNKIQKIQDFQGRAFTFEKDIFVKGDTFFAITTLESEDEDKSGILYKKLGEEAVFLSSEDEYVHFADMGLDEDTNILSGIAFGEHDHEKIFDIKEDENGEYYLDYRHEELHNESNNRILNNGSLLREESEKGSDFVNFYINKACSDGEDKKVLTIEENDGIVVTFKLKGGVFAVEKQYYIKNELVSDVYFVKEDGNVEIIEEINGRKLSQLDFLKIQSDGTLSGKEKRGETFMFDGEKYVFLDTNF